MFENTAHIYDLIYELSGKDYRSESEVIEQLVKRCAPDASTLDVACGTGGHLVHLQHAFDATGLDLSESMLDVARQRVPGVELVNGDMRSFDLGREFDAIVCLFSSIGYLPDPTALGDAIECMSRHLAKGGVLVVDGWVRPSSWKEPGAAHVVSGTRDGIAIARVGRSERHGTKSILELHHLVGTESSVDYLVDRHELTLFTDDEYRAAFASGGLRVEMTESPMPDRDRYVVTKPS
jgi:SAM-dependent methyltransferase